MRESFSSLRQIFHDLTQTTTSDGSTLTTLRDREINNAVTTATSYLSSYLQNVVRTTSTVDGQQYYHYPADISQPPVHATVIDGNIRYPLRFVESPEVWNRLNAIQVESLGIPYYIYPRKKDYGLYPEPQSSSYTIELEFASLPKDMTQDDYTTGTITATTNSQTITGSGTTFASWMAGAWLKAPDGVWYQILTYDSTTQLTLETYYEGSTLSGQTYTVGESPELPPELHELLPHYAAGKYFAGPARDYAASRYHMRMFWTGDPDIDANNEDNVLGGIIGAKKKYSSRSEGSIVYRDIEYPTNPFDRMLWGETLSL